METGVEERVRGLAQPLWESAARPYGMALDFWLMAEQMVLEALTATARMHNTLVSSPAAATPQANVAELPQAAPVNRIRELAQCMWESAGRQYGMAQDFWLSAERHVLTLTRAAAAQSTTPEKGDTIAELMKLSPSLYLDYLRRMAYFSWETTGRSYGQAVDCWLQAERELLEKLMSVAAAGSTAPSSEPLQSAVEAPASAKPHPLDSATVTPASRVSPPAVVS